MNLLENELILSSVQIKNGCYDDALNRLVDTQNLYPDNNMVKNNISVAMCLKNLNNQTKNQENITMQNYQQTLTFLNKAILSNPLDYVSYYNMFNFLIKNKQFSQGLKLLIQAISALYLQKAFNQQSQKIVNLVQKQYCNDCIIVYIVKALIHIKHQKYVIAISELNWIVQNSQKLTDKLVVLQLIKLIFQSLQENEKKHETQQKILYLNTQKNKVVETETNQQTTLRLNSTFQLPNTQEELKNQLSKRLQQFSSLLKEIQFRNLAYSNKTDQLIFKKVNSRQIIQPLTNKEFLYLQLKTSILQSPIYTKSQSKKLGKSRRSQQISINSSQDFTLRQSKQQKIPLTSRKQENHPQMRLSFSPSRNEFNHVLSLRDNEESRRMNNSLNVSGLIGKKKTQNIYPLQRNGQYVEIKLVMAQLNNNKQLLGEMDPYCIINYNNLKQQSSVVKGGGRQPRWKEGFIFQLTQQPTQVIIEVYDKQNFFKKDDFVGSGKFILDKNGFIKIQLFQKNKQAGTIFVTVEAKG